MNNLVRKLLWGMLVLALLQAACSLPWSQTPMPQDTAAPPGPVTAAPSQETPREPLSPEDVYPPSFAVYRPISVRLPQTYHGESYTLPLDLNQVRGWQDLQLSQAQRKLLAQNGFVVVSPVPGKYREFYQIYEEARYRRSLSSGTYYAVPIFITTDSVYHIYHLIFDKMLRDLEKDDFIADLRALTSALLAETTEQYLALKGTPLEEPALRNVAYFGVADRLLGLNDPIPPEAQELVQAELALIKAAGGMQISPIWDRPDLAAEKKLIEDYSQYLPRGHYTRSEDLKQYFRAMMWYGRLTFRLIDDFETRRALLIVQAIRSATASNGKPALTLWQNIYEPTTFIVGKADDLGIYEYGALSDQIFGPVPALIAFADATLFARFKQATASLPPPQINSMWVWVWQDQEAVTKGFRFMGQRFTLDQYVFGQLIWRKVGTQEQPRGLPKGLDFFAAMGSQEALNILVNEMNESRYTNYDRQMRKVQNEIASLGLDSWTQNLYWSWLYALQPLITPKGAPYPPFMQTQAWTRKELQTALGSWTELKHDTILYAKQVMAEMGGGIDTAPRSYVEPNPEAYARLLALAQMTYHGLEARGLLSNQTRANLTNLMDQLALLQDIAERELAGEPIGELEYDKLWYWGGVLEQFTIAAADIEGEGNRPILEDQHAALVADVATGLDERGTLAVLEEAIGQPTPIYVVLPTQPWEVAVGAVFTYYEFTVPLSERLTDETWRTMLAKGQNPPQPKWTEMFIAP
ncbi:MAG: DUF3160 domain-containing protein [Anaerolineales bacterium]|nr:DUF3160 domain-containing protein [Anaerolineales bacterium]